MNDLSEKIQKIKDRLKNSVRRAVVSTGVDIVANTPKYSGQLRASTNISLNSPDLSIVEVANYEFNAIQGTGAAAKRSFEQVASYFKPGDTIHITNNQPYAKSQEYEYGHMMFNKGAANFPSKLKGDFNAG